MEKKLKIKIEKEDNSNWQDLSSFLKEKINQKNIDLSSLSDTLEIKKDYLIALIEDDFEKLPPDIYVRGILFKIANFFSIEANFLWELYKKEKEIKIGNNNLPFEKPKKINFFRLSFWFFIVLISSLIIIYQIFNFLSPPKIEIFTPKTDSVINFKELEIKGKTNANLLKINNKQIDVNKDGIFYYKISLMPGLNIIKIKGINKIGKEVVIERKIIYEQSQLDKLDYGENKESNTKE